VAGILMQMSLKKVEGWQRSGEKHLAEIVDGNSQGNGNILFDSR
jgi:hypothetical protein